VSKYCIYYKSIHIILLFVVISIILSGYPINACATSINEKVYIKTEDTELYADIKGNDRNAPILLYLHGGPANPFGILTLLAYSGPLLEDHFVVIYLQQRGIMKSAPVPDSTHTLRYYVTDIHYVVQYLKNRFKGQDIYLFGHSWGGVLAYLYLLEYEGDVKKFITACAPLNVKSIMKSRYNMTLKWAKETDTEDAIRELSDLDISKIDDDREIFKIMSKWSSVAYGGMMRNVSPKRINEATDDEHLIGQWIKESKSIGDIMFEELMNINLVKKVENLHTPLLVIAGKDDVDSPWKVLRQSIENYGGDKTFLLLENSHHLVYVDEEDKFVESVVKFLREDNSKGIE
jgi:pimeloyl-ACP methyl ester carboxylesterase